MHARRQRRIALVVEDEPFLRAQVVVEFEAKGWTVLDAATGEAAVAYLNEHPIDVVFTDIQLAGRMSGWEVAQALRATEPDVPVIYTSGKAPDRGRQVLGSLFVTKPYDPADIVEACHRLLDPPE